MKVEELMIGDWIIGPDLEPKRVVAILNFDEIQVEEEPDSDTWITYSISDVEPIPLKGWMLTRSGFRRYEKEEWQNWPMENWRYDINDVRISMWPSSGRWFFKHHSSDGCTNVHMPLPTGSVHELQHLLRICGIDQELDIPKTELI